MVNVTITAGILSAVAADGSVIRALAVVSTADIGGGRPNLREGDRVSIDFDSIPGLEPPSGEMVHAFIQTRMPEDPATEAGLTPTEILARRWGERAVQVLGAAATGAELVQTPLLARAGGAMALPKRAAGGAEVQLPTDTPGLTWDPKPSAGLPRTGGVAGGFAEIFNRLREAVGFIDRQGAQTFNDWLQSICTPGCEFRLSGEITAREQHWEFRSTFGSTFPLAGARAI